MTDRRVVFQLNFTKPFIVSTLGLEPDEVQLQLNSETIFRCSDGRTFTDNKDPMKIGMPAQATEYGKVFIASTKNNINDAKNAMLIVKIIKPLIKAVLNSFLASLTFLGFMSI